MMITWALDASENHDVAGLKEKWRYLMANKNVRILILEDTNESSIAAYNYLKQQAGVWIVGVARDESDAHGKIAVLNPDVIVLATEVQVRDQQHMTSSLETDISKIRRINDLNRNVEKPTNTGTPSLEWRVAAMLLELGVPAHILGYHYIREALMMAVENMDLTKRITKELYPPIAKKYRTMPNRVERGIRHGIEVAWKRGGIDANTFSSYAVKNRAGRPTNREFIICIADKIRSENT